MKKTYSEYGSLGHEMWRVRETSCFWLCAHGCRWRSERKGYTYSVGLGEAEEMRGVMWSGLWGPAAHRKGPGWRNTFVNHQRQDGIVVLGMEEIVLQGE